MTCDAGNISKWEKKVGDKVIAGDSLAQLETDKASISFDAQDDFYIAKFLVEEGQEVPVGTPILITVDEEKDVAAFASYVHAAAAPVSPEPAAQQPIAPTPAAAPKIEPPKPVSPPVQASPPQPVKEDVPQTVVAPPAPKPTQPQSTSFTWGHGVKTSPLMFKMSKLHAEYNAKYGFSGHTPLELVKEGKAKK